MALLPYQKKGFNHVATDAEGNVSIVAPQTEREMIRSHKWGAPNSVCDVSGYPFPHIIVRLENAFFDGLSNEQACALAGLSVSRFYEIQRDFPELKEQFNAAKQHTNLKARRNVAERIEKGDIETSKWWLERREKQDFSTRTEHTGSNGGAIQHITLSPEQQKRLAMEIIHEGDVIEPTLSQPEIPENLGDPDNLLTPVRVR